MSAGSTVLITPKQLLGEALLWRKKAPDQRSGYYIQTWGCQMNVEDSEQLQLQLESLGYLPAESYIDAEVIILNTCSVRKKPEDKAFSLLGQLAIYRARGDKFILGVCGCMAQARADEILQRAPHVDFVLGTGDLSQLKALVQEASEGPTRVKRIALPDRKGSVVDDVPQREINRLPKLKSFVPIQYGCDKFCTFCIVPTTRGRERSRSQEDIIEEVAALVSNGTKEISLLGQTVNSWGKNLPEGKTPFSELLWKLNDLQGLERIRYMSPYPRDFRSDLISTIKDCPKVMEHCHLPLQAGHDDLLKRMHRIYTIEGYLEIVRQLREAAPGIGLTTDIIVGFPGETEEEFEATLDVVRKVRFDGAYSFAYSPRPGTPAAEMNQVPQALKMERLNILIELQRVITLEINQSLVGQIFEVLIEGVSPRNPKNLQGYSRESRMVCFEGSPERIGRISNVEITEGHHWGLFGKLV